MHVTDLTIDFQGGYVRIKECGDVLQVTVADGNISQSPQPQFMIRRTVALALAKALGVTLLAPIDFPTPGRDSFQIITREPSR